MQFDYRNIYKRAREVAGLTQERWAEAVGMSVESVRNYEAGTQIPGDEVVKAMSEISGLSQLAYWHLCHKSSLASEILPPVEVVPLPQAVCALLRSLKDFSARHREDCLLDIAADGKVDAAEAMDFEAIVEELDEIVQAALQLKYAEGRQTGVPNDKPEI